MLSLSLAVSLSLAAAAPLRAEEASPAQLAELRTYIQDAWKTLTRSPAALASAAADSKVAAGAKSLVYIPADEDEAAVKKSLQAAMSPEQWAQLDVRALTKQPAADLAPGLLYLPHPYVVPGGRFNEMYGWDSYFILVGLLRDGRIDLAKSMTDNFLYEVKRYGRVLNANRTYYLTRSQPPFLTEMVLGVYGKTRDKDWLKQAVPAMESYYKYWTEGARFTPKTGLSRYWDDGDGPAPEVVSSERDARGLTHYDRVKEFLKTHKVPGYDVGRFYDAKTDALTPFFYKNDRSMRESGFDPSDRFGPFNSEVVDINPICLNSLLYRMETGMAQVSLELDDLDGSARWLSRARARQRQVNALMWDEKSGLYYDYDHAQGKRRGYRFVTTFYPLWAGLADARQAERVRANLGLFEQPGGLQTSDRVTGKQWDSPFGWAPMQLVAVDGLRRYGYDSDADRVAVEFLSMILKDFLAHHAIKEKYDVTARSSDLAKGVKFGYESNEIGFGWTNAAFEELYAQLPEEGRRAVLTLDPAAKTKRPGPPAAPEPARR